MQAWMTSGVMAGLAGWLAVSAQADALMTERYVAGRVVAGQHSFEGPAITGPVDDAFEDSEENGVGFQLEANQPLGSGWFARGVVEWVTYGDDKDFDALQLSAGLGYGRTLAEFEGAVVHGYLIGGAEYYGVSGLDEFRGAPEYGGAGTGEDGDDIGVSLEGGVSATFAGDWEVGLYSKYFSFGDGSGPGFGARVSYALSPSWRLLGSWDGIWVEDAGYTVDIDTQRFTLGTAYTF